MVSIFETQEARLCEAITSLRGSMVLQSVSIKPYVSRSAGFPYLVVSQPLTSTQEPFASVPQKVSSHAEYSVFGIAQDSPRSASASVIAPHTSSP